MAREAYRRRLEDLREDVVEMSERVCERLERALEALERQDDEIATAVITGDHAINERYLALERTCIDLFARQQPVAGEDDEIDRLCADASEVVVRDLLETEIESEIGLTPEALFDEVSRMLLTIRDLERVGDHAVNIAARTLYMVETDDELIY